MQVFLSWSGERSKAAAFAFYNWLPDVLQSVTTWMSSEDIESGAGWSEEIRRALDESNYGIVFITRDNLNAQWLLFEAGAIAKHVDYGRAIPLLVDDDLEPSGITGPFGPMQIRKAVKDGIRRFVAELNHATGSALPPDRFERCFESHWPKLKKDLADLPDPVGDVPEPDQESMLSEILGIVRAKSSARPWFVAGEAVTASVQPRTAEGATDTLGRNMTKRGLNKPENVKIFLDALERATRSNEGYATAKCGIATYRVFWNGKLDRI